MLNGISNTAIRAKSLLTNRRTGGKLGPLFLRFNDMT